MTISFMESHVLARPSHNQPKDVRPDMWPDMWPDMRQYAMDKIPWIELPK